MATPQGNILKLVSGIVDDFERRRSDPVNITNWRVQLMSNDRVKQLVKISGTVGNNTETVEIQNWMPGRFLDKGAWKDVQGGHSEGPKILQAYAKDEIPNPLKECLALVGYFTTLNILGKPISAVSGGRAVLLSTILETVKFKTLTVEIQGLGSGGQGSNYTATLSLDDITRLAQGGRWRGDLVLALNEGGKKANSGGSVTTGAITEEW